MTAIYDRIALEALAEFLPIFEAPDFAFAHNESPLKRTGEKSFEVVGFDYDPQVMAFWDAAERHGWLTTFNWMEWSETEECVDLQDDPQAVEQASPEQLSKLLSMYMRLERFNDGAWITLWDTGLLLGILRRAAVLVGQENINEAS